MTERRHPQSGSGERRRISLERTYRADVHDVWDLWTTKAGIESWWGPGGYAVTVHAIDLRPGGELRYAMTAVDPPQVAFMKAHGMPLTTEARITFTEVVPPVRLAYIHLADFIPGVDPYDVAHVVELHQAGDQVRMVLTIDAMHNDEWTDRAVMGWKSEIGKLDALLAARRGDRP
jgi:uncharacterized protein YndB with AHSA1/START domain